MKTNNYHPQPIDTDNITLPTELKELVEVMAQNTHEIWAMSRINQGWTYGEHRDDKHKTHPCLVDYANLAESEKDYDRNTSIGILKLILKMGFEINKKK